MKENGKTIFFMDTELTITKTETYIPGSDVHVKSTARE